MVGLPAYHHQFLVRLVQEKVQVLSVQDFQEYDTEILYVLVEGRACQSAWKGCEQMIAEPVYPHIVVECRDSSEAIEFWAKDVSPASRLCVTPAAHDVLLCLLHPR